MNCQELREQLHPYLDGELDAPLALEIERALDDCPECRAELEELQALRTMARAAFEGPAAEVDLSHVVGDVMTRLRDEGALRGVGSDTVEQAPGLFTWFKALWTFEQPLVSALTFAIALLALGGLATTISTPSEEAGLQVATPTPTPEASKGESVAEVPKLGSPLEKGRIPTLDSGQHAAFVEHVEAVKGRVVVDANTDDPSKPMVVWHHVDEGMALPVDGDSPGQEL